MSNSYNGTTSVLTGGSTETWGNLQTIAAWFNPVDQGEGGLGVIFAHDDPFRTGVRFDTAGSKKLRFQAEWTTTGFWDMTTGFGTLTGWKWLCVTYNCGSTANNPTFYLYDTVTGVLSVLTVGSGLTKSQAPVGSLSSDNKIVRIGNNAAAGRTWNGLIGEVAMWKRILPVEEILAALHLGPSAIPDYFDYLAQDGGSLQNLGASGVVYTATALSVGENPPAIPAGRRG